MWKGPVTGYCTWWAYRDDFTQKTLDELVDVFAAKKLPDFGYKYIQFDDTYQIGNGSCPQNWLTWNQKFPGGAEYALKKIKSAGMEGGIWVHRVHRPSDPNVADIGKQHPDWFVKKPDGSLFMDGGFYVLNTKNKEAVDGMVRPIYRELKKQGWGYVKIDGAGDLLNAYKNKQCDDHFKKIDSTPEESLRDWDRVAREELGTDIYILNCWGVGPGLNVIGLADGCRLADDGFQPETLANDSSYEGVVWRNDPDHCDILGSWLMDENAKMPVFGRTTPVSVRTIVRPAICSIAGGVLMVSDKVEVYKDDQNLEGMKRSAPVLPTVPGQLYDPGHQVGHLVAAGDRPAVRPLVGAGAHPVGEETGDRSGSSTSRARRRRRSSSRTSAWTPTASTWSSSSGRRSSSASPRARSPRRRWMRTTACRSSPSARRGAHPVGPLNHPPHLAGRRRCLLDETLGRRQQDPLRQERGGRRRSLRADRPSAGRFPAQAPRSAARRSRSPPAGDRHRPHRAVGDQDRGVEDDLCEMTAVYENKQGGEDEQIRGPDPPPG